MNPHVNNTSDNESLLRACAGEHNIIYATFIISVNVIFMLANMLHMYILSRSAKQCKRSYLFILLNISLVDILVSFYHVAVYNPLLPCLPSLTLDITFALIQEVGITVAQCRYNLLALASFDRYFAVCKPYQYSNSKVLNNIGKVLLSVWLINTALSVPLSISPDVACLMSGKVRENSATAKGVVTILVMCINFLVSLLLTTLCLVAVFREVKRMKKRNLQADDKILIKSSHYVIGTIAMFYIFVSPMFIDLFLYFIPLPSTRVPHYVAAQTIVWLQSLYSVGNIAFYAFLQPEYVTKAKKLFTSVCAGKIYPVE
ncbi:rhodopsin, GQ-coupled-like [Watersipora subatra]|uniref:rhodopsin, GQ-coupled-like n=1 Tax=Watersipora subatra TaxID=2589382 RepID=UPI00355C1913